MRVPLSVLSTRSEAWRTVGMALPAPSSITASLAESRNPLGGVDQRCRLRAHLHSGLRLRAEAINGQIETAVGRSVAHLALLVAEALDGGDGRHPPAPALQRRRPVR